MTGYQAEDAEMVTVSSPSADSEAVLLYSAGLDISMATFVTTNSTSGSDSTKFVANAQPLLPDTAPDADLCDNNVPLPQSSVMELPENSKFHMSGVDVT